MDVKTKQVSTVPGSSGMFSPRWSPDGRYLVALDLLERSKTLHLFDFKTNKWADWATDPVEVEYPAWTSDSRYVEYATEAEVKRIRVGETHPETLFSTTGLRQYSAPDFGTWTDSAADNSRMFLRDVSTRTSTRSTWISRKVTHPGAGFPVAPALRLP